MRGKRSAFRQQPALPVASILAGAAKKPTHTYNLSGNPCTGLTDPIAEYSQSGGDRSVTGGFVYRGSLYPALTGRYFYADYIKPAKSGACTKPTRIAGPRQNLSLIPTLTSAALAKMNRASCTSSITAGTIRRLADANGPSPNYSSSTKSASTPHADPGEIITYTIHLQNTGLLSNDPLTLDDVVPPGLTYLPGTLAHSHGTVDDSQSPLLRWQGTAFTRSITITYRVQAGGAVTGSLINRAELTGATIAPLTLSHAIFVPRPLVASTVADFFLPGTQPNTLTANIAPSSGCDFCHTDAIYNSWRGSLMAQAGRDPALLGGTVGG